MVRRFSSGALPRTRRFTGRVQRRAHDAHSTGTHRSWSAGVHDGGRGDWHHLGRTPRDGSSLWLRVQVCFTIQGHPFREGVRCRTAAREIVAKEGLERLSIRGVVAGAGTSTGTYYFHFSNKVAPLLALVEDLAARAAVQIDRVVATAPDEPARGSGSRPNPVSKRHTRTAKIAIDRRSRRAVYLQCETAAAGL